MALDEAQKQELLENMALPQGYIGINTYINPVFIVAIILTVVLLAFIGYLIYIYYK